MDYTKYFETKMGMSIKVRYNTGVKDSGQVYERQYTLTVLHVDSVNKQASIKTSKIDIVPTGLGVSGSNKTLGEGLIETKGESLDVVLEDFIKTQDGDFFKEYTGITLV